MYEPDEVSNILESKLIKTFSELKKNEWEETIDILANNIISTKEDKIVSLIEVGEIPNNLSEELKIYFKKNPSIKNVYKSNSFKGCKNFKNQILILSTGKLNKVDLIKVKEKLDLQSEPILGWINIETNKI